MKLLKQGAVGGLGYGYAVCLVHLAMGMGVIMSLGMPPLTWFAAKTLFIEVPLAVVFGLITSPIHLHTKGKYLQPIAMALIWIAMERFVAIDPDKLQMWLAPPVGALALFYGFQWLWQKKSKVVLGISIAAPIVLLAIPVIKYNFSGGYDVKSVEKSADPPKNAPDVVFIVMDTVQAPHVSAYGYERKTTPRFDAFAKEGALFEQATAPGTWSLPAHASLFTGALPSVNNAHAETRFLDDKMPILAESLAKAGFETRCFTANPHITPGFGLTRGFGWSDNAWLTGAGGRGFTFIYRLIDALGVSAQDKGGALVAGNVADWMSQRPKDAPPAFVFINFLEAHFPFHQLPDEFRYAYTKESLSDLRSYGQIAFGAQMGRQLTPLEFDMIRQPIVDLYDGGVKYTDYLLGKIIDIWRKRGTLDKAIFVILADHGEHVGEHGMFGHVTSVYQQDLRVPFMFRYPPRIKAGQRIAQEVSTLGVFATIFDLLGMKAPETVQVGSLMPAMEAETQGGGKPVFGRPVMSERFEEKLLSSRFKSGTANGKGPLLSPWGRYRTYRSGRFKLAKHFAEGKFSTYLFDLEADPGEMNDLAGEESAKSDLARMEDELKNWEIVLKIPSLDGKPAPVRASEEPKLNDEALEQLKALGYVQE
jgi:arylsulfatase A-like enzyme